MAFDLSCIQQSKEFTLRLKPLLKRVSKELTLIKFVSSGIRKLQAILLKAALIFGAKLHTGVTFEHLVEPNSPEDCWKCKVSPKSHPVSEYEFDVLIGADGKKNVIPGFQQIEMRGRWIEFFCYPSGDYLCLFHLYYSS